MLAAPLTTMIAGFIASPTVHLSRNNATCAKR
jgi:hypothetical protein